MYQDTIKKLRSIQSRSKGALLEQAAQLLEQMQSQQEELRRMTVERDVLARKLREYERKE